MSERVERFKRRQKIKKSNRRNPKVPILINVKSVNTHLSEKADTNRVNLCMTELQNANSIDWNSLKVSENEVDVFFNQFNDKGAAIEALIEPVFLSLIDGSMRAFRFGTKQGLTATRIYNECKSFSYDKGDYVNPAVDRFTEHLNERNNIKEFDSKSEYKGGIFSRKGEEDLNMRDGSKMGEYKDSHFGGQDTAEDEYSPGENIYKDNKTAFEQEGMDPEGKERHPQSAETDHIIPCADLCVKLKSNKALNPNDIKEILNDDSNLAITSLDLNRRKSDKTNEKLIEVNPEEYSNNQKEAMIQKSEEARAEITKKTNQKVVKNITSDLNVQSKLAKDATAASGHRAVGDAIIFFIKPLHYELKDCLINGIEKGVRSSDFKNALKIRVGRMRVFIEKNLKGMFKGGMQNFIKSFFSMLIEGILNCFVGIFKHIARAISEGTRIFIQAIPILNDSTKSAAEKGDAILKIVAFSSTALVGIGIESYLNTLGLSEPWSIIAASVISTVTMALVMYALEKIDLFSLKYEARRARIIEALELLKGETNEVLNNISDPGKEFRKMNGNLI
jgi:hypothetical protein